MLFLFTFNATPTEFSCMLWLIILHEYKSLTHKLCSRWDCMMLQYAVIAGLIQFALHLMQILDFAISKSPPHHNRHSSMLYGCYDTGGCSSFTNSLPHIDPPIWPKDFKLWFVSPKEFIPLLYWPVLVGLAPLETFDIICFLNSSFSTTILTYRPASLSPLFKVDVNTFPFRKLVQLCSQWSAFCQHKLVTLMKLSSALVIAFGLTA